MLDYLILMLVLKGPGCSNSHVPGYLKHPKLKDAGAVFIVAVNDPFV
jgi:2-Cys peroxiredoxin 5